MQTIDKRNQRFLELTEELMNKEQNTNLENPTELHRIITEFAAKKCKLRDDIREELDYSEYASRDAARGLILCVMACFLIFVVIFAQ